MSWAIVAGVVVGGGLSAGGSALSAGQASSAEDQARRRARESRALVASEVNPLANPLIAMIVAQQLARFGAVDPGMMRGAGPLGQFMESLRQAGITGQEQMSIFQEIASRVNDPTGAGSHFGEQVSWLEQKNLDLMNQFMPAGYQVGTAIENLDALINADRQFQQSLEPAISRLNLIAQQSGNRQLAVEMALSQVTQNAAQLGDFDALVQGERTRLTREFGEERDRTLSAANFGGFNPAGTLEQLEQSRQDLDLLALERAAGLSSARTSSLSGVAQLLASLDPTMSASNMNTASLLGNLGSLSQVQQQPGGGQSALGTGLQSAGQGLTSSALLFELLRSGGSPATGQTQLSDFGSASEFPLLFGGNPGFGSGLGT